MFGKEKREFIRLSAHHLLKYKVVGGQDSLSFVRNLSAGGILFYASDNIVVGSILEVKINLLPNPEPIQATIKVVRVKHLKKARGVNIAAVFVNIDDKDKEIIGKKISKYMEIAKKGFKVD